MIDNSFFLLQSEPKKGFHLIWLGVTNLEDAGI